MKNPIKKSRLIVLAVFVSLIAAIFVISLYKLQIVDRQAYSSYEDQHVSVYTRTITAARGDIRDRCGRLLASDRECSNIVIDRLTLINSSDPNGTLYTLISIASSLGIEHTDTLPMTAQRYFSDMSSTQRSRLDAYFEYFDLDSDISAAELFSFFRKHYKIDDSYSEYDARLIIGVRYELELRAITNAAEYIFCSDISIDFMSILAEQHFPGVSVVSGSVREYHTQYAAHILGYTGKMNDEEMEKYTALGYPMDATIGKSGVEAAFESYLHGVDGVEEVTVNSAGMVIDRKVIVEPQPGNTVTLTIDIALQESAEKSLASTIEEINAARDTGLEHADSGAVVAVDVNTGAVLACASYPTYDLSTINSEISSLLADPSRPLYNRATLGRYSPGSTFKMVSAIAALEENVIELDTIIEDKGTYTKYASSIYTPQCWIAPGSHGKIAVSEAIEVSCNYFFYTVGDNLGIDLISSYARSFGLGEKTGVELPEDSGVLASREYKESIGSEPWYPGDTLQAAIGQSYNLFTPMQLAVYTAALANGGTRYSATLLENVKSYDYKTPIYSQQVKILSTVQAKSEYFEAARQGMLAVSKEGTAQSVFGNYFIDVASKTGTAQLGEDKTNNAIFVCFAPYDEPEIAISVVVEKGGSGSAVSGIGRDVLDCYFGSKEAADKINSENSLIK